jgi:hypothetical protein
MSQTNGRGTVVETLVPVRRTLRPAERRLTQARIKSLGVRARRASTRAVPVTAAIVSVLWIWTILASEAPWHVITAFWITVGGALALWVRRNLRGNTGHFQRMMQEMESALVRSEADVYDVRARAFAEFEEVEDEGACYAFELDGSRLLFITGQEFYESAKFPSLDFSLVYVLDEQGQAVEMCIDKRGPKATPAHTIPASLKDTLDIPEHLEIRPGTLDDVVRESTRSPPP